MTVELAAYKAPGRLADKAIRAGTSLRHCALIRYSHVELVGPLTFLDPATGLTTASCIGASKRDGNKVRQKNIGFREGHWDFLSLPAPRIFEDAAKLLGLPYDLLGAILSITAFARGKEGTFFCSQMIAELLGWERPEQFDPHLLVQTALQNNAKLIEG